MKGKQDSWKGDDAVHLILCIQAVPCGHSTRPQEAFYIGEWAHKAM